MKRWIDVLLKLFNVKTVFTNYLYRHKKQAMLNITIFTLNKNKYWWKILEFLDHSNLLVEVVDIGHIKTFLKGILWRDEIWLKAATACYTGSKLLQLACYTGSKLLPVSLLYRIKTVTVSLLNRIKTVTSQLAIQDQNCYS